MVHSPSTARTPVSRGSSISRRSSGPGAWGSGGQFLDRREPAQKLAVALAGRAVRCFPRLTPRQVVELASGMALSGLKDWRLFGLISQRVRVMRAREELAPSTVAHLESHLGALTAAGTEDSQAGWRDCAFIEYYYNDYNAKCMEGCKPPSPGYPHGDTNCVDLTGPDANTVCWCGGAQNCYQTET